MKPLHNYYAVTPRDWLLAWPLVLHLRRCGGQLGDYGPLLAVLK